MTLTVRRWINRAITGVIVVLGLIWTLFPVAWMIRTAVTPDKYLYDTTSGLLPKGVTFANFARLFFQSKFPQFLLNSIEVAVVVTIVSLVFAILSSYSLTRLRFRGRTILTKSILVSYLLPAAVLFIPMYVMVSRLGLADNKWGLVVIYPTFVVPYCCYMLMSYFRAVPFALEEAAAIDGCTRVQTLLKVVLPICAPGLAVVATFSFTMSWNEFMYALVVTTSPSQLTAMVGINSFKFADSFLWGMLMAASVVASVPAIALYLYSQSKLMGEWSEGSVK